ncbi:MAG TPA: protein kinase [Kofleriaceae bacterium]|nr:protein kinase [Kofleriaceae bacterium]
MGDLLGRGGMAEVFAGHSVGDHGFQKPVAIKRLLPELANDEVFVERLIEEAKLLVGMQHGNIVSVLDLAREGDDVFLVMEFVDGPSLRQLIKARGARGISLGVATYIVQSAAAGLEFAHARPGGAIIHADISPSNLLLTTSGEVRVADFGIARREGLGHGVVEGKWAYMAPEQARGEPLTPRSDVFALGVVLYELLTGQHPFGRAVTPDQRDDQMRVIPPRVVKPSVPHGLDAICMRALAHDARDRYGRMQQLIDALVEERFTSGYREGASDLAQAIREVAPRSDVGSPRTMHTERPVTLMTRSLLREVTPPRRPSQVPSTPSTPSRASSPSQAPSRASAPAYPLGPNDPPPRDAFPMQPTVGAQTMALLGDPPPQALPDSPPADAFPQVPSSGAQTVARIVDQVALAEAAQAAAAAMLLPGALRADGAPMPPFRMAQTALPGDELASVVGGHTMTAHGGAAVAIESPRSHRWTIIVLAAAALFGVIAAIASQLTRDRVIEPAPRAAPTSSPGTGSIDEAPARPESAEVAQAVPSSDPAGSPTAQPVSQPAVAEASQPATQPAVQPAIQPTAQPTIQPTIQPTAQPPAQPTIQPTIQPTAQPPAQPTIQGQVAPPVELPAEPAPAPGAAAITANPPPVAPIVIDPATLIDPGASRETGRPARRSGSKEATRRRAEPGILSVTSVPWSWVTVGNQTKETPAAKFYLAPGTYQVTFHNQENGLVKVERVTIESGKLKKLSERMDR